MAIARIFFNFHSLDNTPVCAQTYIYWVNSGANRIQRADLDGQNIATVINVNNGTTDVAVDATNGKIYWTVSNDRIRRANIDGSSAEDIVTGLRLIPHLH